MKSAKITIAAAILALAWIGAAIAASYTVIEIKSRGPQDIAGIGVGLAKLVEVQGALPANATVKVSRISGVVTTTVATVACTGGHGTAAACSNVYLVAGDRLLQSGATNAPLTRLIVEE